MNKQLQEIVQHFKIEGEVIGISPYGFGHINTTYLVETTKKRYIMQKINDQLFTNVDHLMSNIFEVTSYIKCHFPEEETLTLIDTKQGKYYLTHPSGYYRIYDFIEHTVCLQIVTKEEEFYESARAFGKFSKLLSGFEAGKLYEILKDFHHTGKRYESFLEAMEKDIAKRKENVAAEIQFVTEREKICRTITDLLEKKQMPLRVTHNDTKLNNVLLDEKTLRGKAVIDLDTVMPGSICYDFGDSIRFGCNSSYEDDPNLNQVFFRMDLFEVYVRGYLEEVGNELTMIEKDNLVNGAILMTFECGMRFLTDYLNHDTYFKITRENHNLDRCRTQFKLVEEMEKQKDEMQRIVDSYFHSPRQ